MSTTATEPFALQVDDTLLGFEDAQHQLATLVLGILGVSSFSPSHGMVACTARTPAQIGEDRFRSLSKIAADIRYEIGRLERMGVFVEEQPSLAPTTEKLVAVFSASNRVLWTAAVIEMHSLPALFCGMLWYECHRPL